MRTCLLITPDLEKSSWCKDLLAGHNIPVVFCTNFSDLHQKVQKKFTFVIFVGEELPDTDVNSRNNFVKQGEIIHLLEINGYKEEEKGRSGNLLRLYLESPRAEKVLGFIEKKTTTLEPTVHFWPEMTREEDFEHFSMVC